MASKRKHNPAQFSLFPPESNWKPPTELPDLRGRVKQMAVDTEGRDDGLTKKRGSGWPTKEGFISGLAVAWREGTVTRSFYAPVRHPDTECMFVEKMAGWLKDHMDAGIQMIMHHGAHDLGWLRADWKLNCNGAKIADTEAMAMLVDENRLSYALDRLCTWRKIPGKDERLLTEAAELYHINPKADLWQLPAKYVGPYAEQDAIATLCLAENLTEEINKQELGAALQLEHDLMPMVLEMRLRGVAVDEEAATNRKIQLLQERDHVLKELGDHLGKSVSIEDCRSPGTLEDLFNQCRIDVPYRTEKKGRPSFKAVWMRKHPHWLPRLVARAEQLTEAAEKFIQGFILDYLHKGRIHAAINQFRGEEGGTRSYRFSYANPPLQQAPHRDEEFAKAFRGAFKPEQGEFWASCDYSQQEYRLIVHYANKLGLPKAAEAAQLYLDNPDTDFHALVAEWTGLPRKPAKDSNFAKAYGAGISRFAEMIGKSEEEAKAIMVLYDQKLPFVSALNKMCMNKAENAGWLMLLDGARSHFDAYERAWYERGVGFEGAEPSLEAARAKWPNVRLRRAHLHKALNRLIQGSAARQTKMWMRACWQEGYLPLIQMHDELCFSVSEPKQVEHICELGRDVIELSVPMKVDSEIGWTWGSADQEAESPAEWNEKKQRHSGSEIERERRKK